MHPVVRAAAAVAVLSAIGMLEAPRRAPVAPAPTASVAPGLASMSCGPRSIPEGEVCVPLPGPDEPLGPASADRRRATAARSHDLIPRRPDRPADPLAIRYPLASPVRLLYFGFDASSAEPDDEASALTEGAVDLAAERGAPVKVVALDGQDGKADVIGLGDLYGSTVVTLHAVTENGRKRHYLVFYGRLDAFGPDVAVDRAVDDGAIIGFAGDSGTPGVVHLHLEIRQVRDDLDVHPLELARLADQAVSIPCDVRNVLPAAR